MTYKNLSMDKVLERIQKFGKLEIPLHLADDVTLDSVRKLESIGVIHRLTKGVSDGYRIYMKNAFPQPIKCPTDVPWETSTKSLFD